MSALDLLLDLQGLDTRVDQLRHRLEHDGVHAALSDAERRVVDLEAARGEAEGRREEIRRTQKRFEDESASCGEKIEKENAKLYGGAVTAPKELEALQTEIRLLTARQNDLDDHVIEQMELAEPVDAELTELDGRLAEARAATEHARGDVTVMQAEVGADLDDTLAKRDELATTLDATLLAHYEKLRSQLGGQGAAKLAPGGRCEGCHLTLPSAEYDAVKRAPEGEVLLCPECGRILVR